MKPLREVRPAWDCNNLLCIAVVNILVSEETSMTDKICMPAGRSLWLTVALGIIFSNFLHLRQVLYCKQGQERSKSCSARSHSRRLHGCRLPWKIWKADLLLHKRLLRCKQIQMALSESKSCLTLLSGSTVWLQIAVDYTESQVDDILHLRQLLVHKQGQLARERRALLSKIECSSTERLQNPGEKFSELTQCSEQLRQNGAMEYRAYIEYCGAYHAGVSSLLHCR